MGLLFGSTIAATNFHNQACLVKTPSNRRAFVTLQALRFAGTAPYTEAPPKLSRHNAPQQACNQRRKIVLFDAFSPRAIRNLLSDPDTHWFPHFQRNALRYAVPGGAAAYYAPQIARYAIPGGVSALAGPALRMAGTLAGGPATAGLAAAASVMNSTPANAGEVPFYIIDPITGRYVPNPALNGATHPGGTPTGVSPAPVAPAPASGPTNAAAPAQQSPPLPFAGPDSNTQPSGVMPQGSPGAAGGSVGSPLLQMAQAYIANQGQLQAGAGGAAPAQQPQAPATAGYYGGSPETNPNLQPVDRPYSDPGFAGVSNSGPTALLQKLISALGGVTNGGALSPIGNIAPGKFSY